MKPPACDPKAERAVLGALITTPARATDIAAILRPEDFSDPWCAQVYQALLNLDGRGAPFDAISVAAEVQRTTGKTGGAELAALVDLDTAAPSAWNLLEYAKIVAEHALRRRVLDQLRQTAMRAQSPSVPAAQVIAEGQHALLELATRHQGGDLQSSSHVVNATLDLLDALRKSGGGITGLPTGLRSLDRMLTGLHPGELLIAAARPGVGKTILGLGIAAHVAIRAKTPAAFFSLEMEPRQLMMRVLAAEACVSLHEMRSGQLSDASVRTTNDASARVANAPLFIDYQPGLSLLDLRAKARRLKHKHPNLGLLVVDYLQIMTPAISRGGNREGDVAQISRGLKVLAGELGLPVLALAQINRKSEERRDKRPQLSDLRESGSIEADADVVLLLHPEQVDPKPGEAPPKVIPIELIVAKQRNGPTGSVKLTQVVEQTRFSEVTNSVFFGAQEAQ